MPPPADSNYCPAKHWAERVRVQNPRDAEPSTPTQELLVALQGPVDRDFPAKSHPIVCC